MEQAAITLARQSTGPSNRPLVEFRSVADLEADRKSRADAEQAQNAPFITGLAADLKSKWEVARFARNTIEERIIDSLRRRNGEYDPEKLAQIRSQGGSEVYMMLTSIKCRAAEAWINDIEFSAGENPWEVEPTAIPELDPEMEQSVAEYVAIEAQTWQQEAMQVLPPEALEERMKQLKDQISKRMEEQAHELADRMGLKIEDQLQEGNWEEAMKEVIKDVVTYPIGCIKGPVVRKRKTLKWKQDEKSGFWVAETGYEFRLEYYRVPPFDLYPSPSSKSTQDGYLIERHRLRRADLVAMKGVKGYNDGAIDLVLDAYGKGGLREWLWRDQERAWLEKRPNEWLHHDDTIDTLEIWASVSGHMLLDYGMDPEKIPDKNQEYEINAWMIGNYVIRAVLNEDPLGARPYDKCSFEEIPGAFWGYGVPEIMKDLQDVCNAAARSIVNNMAIASGPQVEVHTDRIPVGEDIESLHPWKVWQTLSDPHGTNNPAVRFHNPQSYSKELLGVYEYFSGLADEYTGIPKYSYGEASGSGGPASTASGFSMLLTGAARGIKMVVGNIDKPIRGTVSRTYTHNMLYSDDQSIKGDLKVNARGSKTLVAKEQQMIRRNEFLQQTNNPVDMQIIGPEGRATLLRESVKSFDIKVDDVVPDREQLMQKVREAAQAEMMQQPEGGRTLDQAGNPVGGQDVRAFG